MLTPCLRSNRLAAIQVLRMTVNPVARATWVTRGIAASPRSTAGKPSVAPAAPVALRNVRRDSGGRGADRSGFDQGEADFMVFSRRGFSWSMFLFPVATLA